MVDNVNILHVGQIKRIIKICQQVPRVTEWLLSEFYMAPYSNKK
jgi:hypothetical protein